VNGYAIELARSADRELRRLPAKMIRRIARAIDQLQVDPRPRGSENLVGSESTYRIRVGDFRVIYEIEDEAHTLLVTRIRHRKDAYQ
jgi:mRNA interferase RelE/StbE